MNRNVVTASFLDHVPVALAFGTSGLRGLVKDITDLEAYINVKGTLRYLLATGDLRPNGSVVIAGDLRPSTNRIMRAAARAITDSGADVENAGTIPTPALILHAIATGRPGVMVTGSHIPFDRNGIKINKSIGEILKSDEAGITLEVERVRAEEYGRTSEGSAFAPSGMLKASPALGPALPAAEERYLGRYLTSFPPGGLSGLRVILYEHSAVGRELLGRILRELGAEVVPAGRTETFTPIDTENVTDELLDRLEGLVAGASDGRPFDAVVSTDGDSDRPLVAAVLPPGAADASGRRVRFLSGDLLGIVVAEYLRADAVVVPISANDAVERRMRDRSVVLRKTKIGSPYVVAGMNDLRSEKPSARVVGWEANGGFMVGSAITTASGIVDPLPTRDAALPILANLFAAVEAKVGLAALWDRLPQRFGRAGLIDDVPVATSQSILARLAPPGEITEVEFDRAGGILRAVGANGKNVGVDGGATSAWQERRSTLRTFFTPALGFDEVRRINLLDGVRVYFESGDVAHIRPSGNAPQLRIYANSDSQARADEIVELGLREPNGILRSMEKAFSR